MAKALLSIFIVLLAALNCAAQPHAPYASVAPLQQITMDMDGQPVLRNVCGSVSINEKEHLWLTAYHCISDEPEHYILGDVIQPVMKDTTNDLAIVKTPNVGAPAVPIASTAPAVGDDVFTIGFPLQSPYPLLFMGKVAHQHIERDHPYVVFALPVAPGASGSPIFNAAGELISVVQRGYHPSTYTPVGAGVTIEKLQGLRYWWDK